MEWLSMPDTDRPDLILLYFDEPDHQGHGTGPDSPEVSNPSPYAIFYLSLTNKTLPLHTA